MTAGVPGTGIGGLFYLLGALWMPCYELFLTMRGQSSLARWYLVGRQTGIALGIICGMWATGWLLGLLLPAALLASLQQAAGRHSMNVLQLSPFLATMLVLFGVICTTRALHWLIQRDRVRVSR
jgi:hypothetical protein